MPRPMHQENMEPEDDLSTPDPLDLLSDQGALPSTSSSLLSCTLLVQKDIPISIFSICLMDTDTVFIFEWHGSRHHMSEPNWFSTA